MAKQTDIEIEALRKKADDEQAKRGAAEKARDKALELNAHTLRKFQAEHHELVRLRGLINKAYDQVQLVLGIALTVPECRRLGSPANRVWVETRELFNMIRPPGGRDENFDHAIRTPPAKDAAGPGQEGGGAVGVGSKSEVRTPAGDEGSAWRGTGAHRSDPAGGGESGHSANAGTEGGEVGESGEVAADPKAGGGS
jgi:hypothetical protein